MAKSNVEEQPLIVPRGTNQNVPSEKICYAYQVGKGTVHEVFSKPFMVLFNKAKTGTLFLWVNIGLF